MKDRIRQIMESQHMTQQVFADFIGLAPATLSSIYNERTRPTLSVVEAIKKKIPNISTDWLMFGSGEMYVASPASSTSPTSAGSMFSANDGGTNGAQIVQNPMLDFDQSQSPTPQQGPQAPYYINSVKSTPSSIERTEVKIIDKPQRKVKEIRVFYDDQTWETFVPEKK
ncbi:MAG: helix-turn-helix transcriptional regulator [Prevotella sp.]|nr:helix-turn-helix transcriptional regulator [Prevotella sp.]